MVGLQAQSAMILLRSCFGAAKLTFVLRRALCWDDPLLQKMDNQLRSGLEKILNVELDDVHWKQATLPIRDGGLGSDYRGHGGPSVVHLSWDMRFHIPAQMNHCVLCMPWIFHIPAQMNHCVLCMPLIFHIPAQMNHCVLCMPLRFHIPAKMNHCVLCMPLRFHIPAQMNHCVLCMPLIFHIPAQMNHCVL